MGKTEITKDISIENLIENYPFAAEYLMEKGIRCIRCGEPIWGSLEDAATEKGFDTKQIQDFVDEMKDKAETKV